MVGVQQAGRRQHEDHVRLLQPAGLDRLAAGEERGLRWAGVGGGGGAKVRLSQAQKLVLVHGAGDADHQAVGSIEAGAPGLDVSGVGRRQGLRRAQDRPAHGLVREGGGLGQLEDLVVGGVGGLGDLLADDVLLAGQVLGVQGRALDDVGGDGHGQRQSAGQGADLEAGALVPGGGVDLAAGRFDDLHDVAGGAAAGALEDHVFQKVGPARARGVLPARAAAGDDAEGQGLVAGRGVADHRDAVGQPVQAGGAHAVTNSRT